MQVAYFRSKPRERGVRRGGQCSRESNSRMSSWVGISSFQWSFEMHLRIVHLVAGMKTELTSGFCLLLVPWFHGHKFPCNSNCATVNTEQLLGPPWDVPAEAEGGVQPCREGASAGHDTLQSWWASSQNLPLQPWLGHREGPRRFARMPKRCPSHLMFHHKDDSFLIGWPILIFTESYFNHHG